MGVGPAGGEEVGPVTLWAAWNPRRRGHEISTLAGDVAPRTRRFGKSSRATGTLYNRLFPVERTIGGAGLG